MQGQTFPSLQTKRCLIRFTSFQKNCSYIFVEKQDSKVHENVALQKASYYKQLKLRLIERPQIFQKLTPTQSLLWPGKQMKKNLVQVDRMWLLLFSIAFEIACTEGRLQKSG